MKKLIITMVLALAASSVFIFGGCNQAQDDTSSRPTEPAKATQAVSSETQTQQSAAEEPEDSSQEETQPQASSGGSPQDSPDSSEPQDTPDLTGKWEPAAGESIASGQAVSLSEIYGSGLSYGGSLELNSDGTFFVGVGIISDNSSHKGTYTVSGNEIHVTYKNGTEDTFQYLADYNGGEAVKAPQGDYYIYFCR